MVSYTRLFYLFVVPAGYVCLFMSDFGGGSHAAPQAAVEGASQALLGILILTINMGNLDGRSDAELRDEWIRLFTSQASRYTHATADVHSFGQFFAPPVAASISFRPASHRELEPLTESADLSAGERGGTTVHRVLEHWSSPYWPSRRLESGVLGVWSLRSTQYMLWC